MLSWLCSAPSTAPSVWQAPSDSGFDYNSGRKCSDKWTTFHSLDAEDPVLLSDILQA